MLSPYKLHYLVGHKAFYFDSKVLQLIEIKEKKSESLGNIYSHNTIMRSLIQQKAHYTDQFIQELYSVNSTGDIIFIVALEPQKAYFLSLNVKNKPPHDVREMIKSLKKDQEQLSLWFDEKCTHNTKKTNNGTKDFKFPCYQLPEIDAHIMTEDNKTYPIKISKVSLTDIFLVRKEDFKLKEICELTLSVGKNNYSLAIIKEEGPSDHLSILHNDHNSYKSWLQFIKVMHLRQSSSSERSD